MTDSLGSLAELLRFAEKNNPQLRAAFDRWTAALETVPQAKALPDPRLFYGYFIEPVETRVGPQRQKFGISQSIPLFGKLGLRGDIARHSAHTAGAQFAHERLALRFRISQLWNDYYYLSRAIAVTEQNLELMANIENVVLSQYSAGKTAHSEVIRVQVELVKLEDRLRSLQDQQRPFLVSLNSELNRPAHATISRPAAVDSQPVPHILDELQRLLTEHNPQLAALRSRSDKDAAAAKLAGKSAIPDLSIGLEYIDTDQARVPNVPDSGKDAIIASASITLPLWYGQHRAEKAAAVARRYATARDLTQLHNRLIADLERAHFEFHDAEHRVELYTHSLLPKARQSLEVTENAFITGEADFLDLIDSQRTLLEFELSYERALADRATARAHLERIVGRDLTVQ
jgi:outer membrane protein TolC